MKQVKILKKCNGCGAILQSNDKDKIGYIPSLNDNKTLCMRCFRIKHYNDFSNFKVSYTELTKIIKKVNNENILIVYMIDILNIDLELLKKFEDKDVLFVINKRDLLPKNINDNRIINFFYSILKKENIKVKDISLISATTKLNLNYFLKQLNYYKKNRSVYFLGSANSGKSTIINYLITKLKNINYEITTSKISGTTIDLIKIPINHFSYYIDTPGYISNYNIIKHLDIDNQIKILPVKTIKPKVFQLNSNQSLFVDKHVIIDYLEGDFKGFSFYFKTELKIHRTKLNSKNRIISNYEIDIDKFSNNIFLLDQEIKYNIFINSLGFISVLGPVKINIQTYKKVKIGVYDALV